MLPLKDMVPETLWDAFILISKTDRAISNPKFISNLKTAFKRYIFPSSASGWAFSEKALKEIEQCLAKVTIRNFIKSEPEKILNHNLNKLVDAQKIKYDTAKNYRSAIGIFLRWMCAQDWYHEAAGTWDGIRAPRLKVGASIEKARRGLKRKNAIPYKLRLSELTPSLKKQFEAKPYELVETDFSIELLQQLNPPEDYKPKGPPPHYGFRYFCTARKLAKRQGKVLRDISYSNNERHVLCFLGWLKNIRGWQLDSLSLELMANKETVDEFITWAINEKGNAYGWATKIAITAQTVIKWLHHRRSNKPGYLDIEQLEVMKAYTRELEAEHKSEPSQLAIDEKLITFEQCQKVVEHLRKCCAPLQSDGAQRPEMGIMRSWQRYLIIAILTYCPIRQREIRELELGKTLFKERIKTELGFEKFSYVVRLSPDDHKTGSKTGKGREFDLPDEVVKDLEEWLTVWRPKIKTEHDLVFTQLGSNEKPDSIGTPLTASGLSGMVKRTMYRVTSLLFEEPKRTTPHIFRNIAITWQRQHGSQEQREPLAELMGHDPKTADDIYDQTTSREKTKKAKDWWKKQETIEV